MTKHLWSLHAVDLTAKWAAPWVINRFVAPVNKDAPPSDFKPGRVLVFIGGGHASGKSAIKDQVLLAFQQSEYLRRYLASFGSDNFKDVAQHPLLIRLRNHYVSFLHDLTTGKQGPLHQIANAVFDKVRQTAFSQGSPSIVDNHMDEPHFVERVVNEARSEGYECIFIAPHVDMDIIFDRLEVRKAATGIPYDRKRVAASHRGFATCLDTYFKTFDAGLIVDNNGVPGEIKPIAFSHKGKVTVLNPKAFHAVRAKGNFEAYAASHAIESLTPRTISRRPLSGQTLRDELQGGNWENLTLAGRVFQRLSCAQPSG